MKGVPGEFGPDGYCSDEFVALSDAGDVVPLQIADELDPYYHPKWLVGDGSISWVGRRRDNDPLSPTFGDIIEGGLYVTELGFDDDGNINGIAAPSQLLVSFDLVDGLDPDIGGYNWSPDGSAFVFTTISRRELVIADLITGSFAVVLPDGMHTSFKQAPRWSPSGDQFLIRYNGESRSGIWVMNIDGSGLTMVEAYRTTSQAYVGAWSPTGSHLIYQHHDNLLQDTYIVRTRSDGKGKSRISDKSFGAGFGAAYPLGWRN
jgi:hypothetical protein